VAHGPYEGGALKILCVSDLMNPGVGGGATDRDYQMCRHLSLAGEQVTLLTTKWQLDEEYVARLPNVDVHATSYVYMRYLLPLGARRWLDRNVRRFDVVHVSKNWNLLANLAASSAARHGIPYAFSSMGFIAIHNRSRALKRVYRKFLTAPLLAGASAFIAVTAEERADLVNAGAAPEKIHLIPNGIVAASFAHRDDAHFRRMHGLGDKRIILFIGRMDPIKGVHLLIDAFRRKRPRLEGWALALVGTRTAYRAEMERRAADLVADGHAFFIDPLFGNAKSEAYHACDLVAIPSIKDAMTIIAPEAACCGKPVLITSTSDFGELARRGAAVEVEPTVDAIEAGLDALTRDESLRVAMGQKGRDYVMSTFGWERLVFSYLDVFRGVARQPIHS
jgi:glycosyltransferase involved in cell wall biosynthesis